MSEDETKLAPEEEVDSPRRDTIPAPVGDPLIGTLLDERYLLEEQLGEGGMGHVYRARHVLMGKQVAVKLIHAELAHVDEIAKRFEREARSSSKLKSPHCISVTDFGRTADNELYLAMELLEGEELDERLERLGPMEIPDALKIIKQILKGLAHAHEQGVVHRDLKPENIYLIKHGDEVDFVKILDFGIAKMASDQGSENLTKTGMVFGTPKYLSPEQALGDKTDHRADLYAVGIILFEVLTGHPPYEAETAMDTLSMHLTAQPPKLSQYGTFPRQLQKIIEKAMSKKPDQRYDDAESFMKAIEDVDLYDNSEITIAIPNIVAEVKAFTDLRIHILNLIWSSKRRKAITSAIVVGLAVLAVISSIVSGTGEPDQFIKKEGDKAPVVVPSEPDESPVNNQEILALLEDARKKMEGGLPEEAAVLARKALAIDSKAAPAKIILGHALFASDKKVGALYQYQQAIDIDETKAGDERMLDNLREGLQWEDVRRKSARMLAAYGTDKDREQLASLCNSALTDGEVRRAARAALEKTGHLDKIDWYATLTADFHEQKGCKERNKLISLMVQTGDEAFVPYLEEFRPKTKGRRRGPKKTENACIKGSVEYAIRVLSGEGSDVGTDPNGVGSP